MGAGRPPRAHNLYGLWLRTCGHRSVASLAEQLRNRGIQLEFGVTPRLVEVMIKLSERHSAHRSPAGDDILVSDQYQPLGGRMKLMARIEEVHSGGPGQPLAHDHHCHLIINVELSEGSLRGVGGDNAVVGCEPRVRSRSMATRMSRSLSTASSTGCAMPAIPSRTSSPSPSGAVAPPTSRRCSTRASPRRLHRANDLMLGRVLAGVAAGVLVLRGVAAPHLTIGHTHPQMDPGVTELEALLAARRRGRDVVDLIKVRHSIAGFPRTRWSAKRMVCRSPIGVVSCLDRFWSTVSRGRCRSCARSSRDSVWQCPTTAVT